MTQYEYGKGKHAEEPLLLKAAFLLSEGRRQPASRASAAAA
jgi:hypothetical protein